MDTHTHNTQPTFTTLANALAYQCYQLTSTVAESPLTGADYFRSRLDTYLAPIRRLPTVIRVTADLPWYYTQGSLRLYVTIYCDDFVNDLTLAVTARPCLHTPGGFTTSAHWHAVTRSRFNKAWLDETRGHLLELVDNALRQPPRLADGHLRVVPQ